MEVENMEDKNSFWSFKGFDDYIDSLFLMQTPFPVLTILGMYLLFVLKIGPEYMKNRPPYKLNKLLLYYNAFQVALSLYLFKYGVDGISDFGLLGKECLVGNKALVRRLAFGHHLYFIAKLTELLDTVFFVLRKKWNQVTFLHVYHHSIMYIGSWTTLKYEPTYSVVFMGTLNSFVHVAMYSYYGLSAFPSLRKFLWWKKYITVLQLTQFVLVLIQVMLDSYTSECPLAYILRSLTYIHIVLFVCLFSDFYIKNYQQKRKDAANSAKSTSNKSEDKELKSAIASLKKSKNNLDDKKR